MTGSSVPTEDRAKRREVPWRCAEFNERLAETGRPIGHFALLLGGEGCLVGKCRQPQSGVAKLHNRIDPSSCVWGTQIQSQSHKFNVDGERDKVVGCFRLGIVCVRSEAVPRGLGRT